MVVVFTFLLACVVAMTNAQCTSGEFLCSDGECISSDYECDGYNNCVYGADEDDTLCYPDIDIDMGLSVACMGAMNDAEFMETNGGEDYILQNEGCVPEDQTYGNWDCDDGLATFTEECEDAAGRICTLSATLNGACPSGEDQVVTNVQLSAQNYMCFPHTCFDYEIEDYGDFFDQLLEDEYDQEYPDCSASMDIYCDDYELPDDCYDDGGWQCDNGDCIGEDLYCDGDVHCEDYSDEPDGCQNYDGGTDFGFGMSDECLEAMGDGEFEEDNGHDDYELLNEDCVPENPTSGSWDCDNGLATYSQKCSGSNGRICTNFVALSGTCPFDGENIVQNVDLSAQRYECFPDTCVDSDIDAYNDFFSSIFAETYQAEYPDCYITYEFSCDGSSGDNGGSGGSFFPGNTDDGDGGGGGAFGGDIDNEDACFDEMNDEFNESNGTPQYAEANEDCITEDIEDGPFVCDKGLTPFENKCHMEDGMMCTTRVFGKQNNPGSEDCEHFGFTHFMCVPDVCTREDVADMEDVVEDIESDVEVQLLVSHGLNCDIDIQFTCAAYSLRVSYIIVILSAMLVAVMD